jgi:hypothetical protein
MSSLFKISFSKETNSCCLPQKHPFPKYANVKSSSDVAAIAIEDDRNDDVGT